MEETKAKLIQLAAEMARGKNMPSEFSDDWKFPKTTPALTKRTVIKCAEAANEQSKLWSIKLRDIADAL